MKAWTQRWSNQCHLPNPDETQLEMSTANITESAAAPTATGKITQHS